MNKLNLPEVSSPQNNINLIVGKLNEVIDHLNLTNQVIAVECLHVNAYDMNRNDMWRCKDCKKVFKKEIV